MTPIKRQLINYTIYLTKINILGATWNGAQLTPQAAADTEKEVQELDRIEGACQLNNGGNDAVNMWNLNAGGPAKGYAPPPAIIGVPKQPERCTNIPLGGNSDKHYPAPDKSYIYPRGTHYVQILQDEPIIEYIRDEAGYIQPTMTLEQAQKTFNLTQGQLEECFYAMSEHDTLHICRTMLIRDILINEMSLRHKVTRGESKSGVLTKNALELKETKQIKGGPDNRCNELHQRLFETATLEGPNETWAQMFTKYKGVHKPHNGLNLSAFGFTDTLDDNTWRHLFNPGYPLTLTALREANNLGRGEAAYKLTQKMGEPLIVSHQNSKNPTTMTEVFDCWEMYKVAKMLICPVDYSAVIINKTLAVKYNWLQHLPKKYNVPEIVIRILDRCLIENAKNYANRKNPMSESAVSKVVEAVVRDVSKGAVLADPAMHSTSNISKSYLTVNSTWRPCKHFNSMHGCSKAEVGGECPGGYQHKCGWIENNQYCGGPHGKHNHRKEQTKK